MKKQLFTSVMCLVLLLLMLFGSTLAWFTDNTANVNTMVVGKISIKQEETFVQDTIIMPNVPIEKNVVVTNNGNLPCYVRTLFAFEDSNDVDVLKLIELNDSGIVNGEITIDGITNNNPKVQFTVTRGTEVTAYTVGYYIHQDPLAVGDTINPLTSLTLSGTADNTWHQKVGEKYELFVLSQATQVDGMSTVPMDALNTAFLAENGLTGEICATWFAHVLNGDDAYTPDGTDATVSGTVITIAPVPTP